MINNFIKRLFSSIFLIPISFYIIIKGELLFIFFLTACLILSLIEWKKMITNKFIKIFGFFFIIFSFYSAYYLRSIDKTVNIYDFLIIIIICVLTDIGCYVFGKILRGPKINTISPNKTYAGMFGGFFSSIFFLYLIISFVDFFNNYSFIFNSKNISYILFLSLINQVGDFIISYFKRLSKIKDTGSLIPGHGGILDRIDGMIFVFPFAFFLQIFL